MSFTSSLSDWVRTSSWPMYVHLPRIEIAKMLNISNWNGWITSDCKIFFTIIVAGYLKFPVVEAVIILNYEPKKKSAIEVIKIELKQMRQLFCWLTCFKIRLESSINKESESISSPFWWHYGSHEIIRMQVELIKKTKVKCYR